MATIDYMILILYALLACSAIVECLINLSDINKRIDEILTEEKRQNKRIDVLEKREQIRQLKQHRDKVYNDVKDLFKEW